MQDEIWKDNHNLGKKIDRNNVGDDRTNNTQETHNFR